MESILLCALRGSGLAPAAAPALVVEPVVAAAEKRREGDMGVLKAAELGQGLVPPAPAPAPAPAAEGRRGLNGDPGKELVTGVVAVLSIIIPVADVELDPIEGWRTC